MENTTQPQTQPQNDVTITDLFILKEVLDVSIKRGTFRGDELVQIGAIYTKLTNFLNIVSAQAQEAQMAQQAQEQNDQPQQDSEPLQGE